MTTQPPPKIIRNLARCRRCGDTIESMNRHDFVRCKCGAVAVDGGRAYLRRCVIPGGQLDELSEVEEVKL